MTGRALLGVGVLVMVMVMALVSPASAGGLLLGVLLGMIVYRARRA